MATPGKVRRRRRSSHRPAVGSGSDRRSNRFRGGLRPEGRL